MSRKNRSRNTKSLARRRPFKRPRKSVLIVCEGSKTEPNYFRALRHKLRLTSAEVEVVDDSDSAPISVVNAAQERQRERQRDAKRDAALVEYDEVWCAMDVEVPEHHSLAAALDKAGNMNIKTALSNPCFEFWYLLHFEQTGRQFQGCARVVARLSKHVGDYEKGMDWFQRVYPSTATAAARARNLFLQQWQSEDDPRCCNPCTQVHELVEHLHAIVDAPLPDGS